MREIIQLQIGQCGIQVSTQFWQTIIQEHSLEHEGNPQNLTDYQREKIGVYFSEQKNGCYYPRTILMDLEPGSIECARASEYGKFYNPANMIFEQQGAGSNWAKGYMTNGAELVSNTVDSIQKELETCDSLQGFQMMHSLGGGTGSGMGMILAQRLKEMYPDKVVQTFSVLPSEIVSDTVTEPYNAILSINQLIETVDSTMIFDNQAPYEICQRIYKITNPTYNDLNKILASTMSNITSSLRFPNVINQDLRKLEFNLIPFPRLHFILSSFAPLYSQQIIQSKKVTVPELYQQTFDSKNMLTFSDPRYGRYLCGFNIFRGDIQKREAIEQVMSVSNKNSSYFIEYIPNNMKYVFCDIPPLNYTSSSSLIGNNTVIQENFKKVQLQFRSLFQRKAFLHWYLDEGVEEMEFIEAENNLNDLISEYQQYQDATISDDEFEEEEEINQQNSALT